MKKPERKFTPEEAVSVLNLSTADIKKLVAKYLLRVEFLSPRKFVIPASSIKEYADSLVADAKSRLASEKDTADRIRENLKAAW